MLTLKLCVLFLLVSAQRVQTNYLTRLSCIVFHDNGCTVHIVGKLKNTRPGYHQAALEIPKFDEEKLCVVLCMNYYIERTTEIKAGCDKLLLCYCKPHEPASKDSVARWLKEVFVKAGIHDYAPHSFRSAS